MSKKASLSSEEKSGGTAVLSLSPAEVNEWRMRGPEVRSGVACKCGSHSSTNWDEGGAAWFESHVLEHHISDQVKLLHLVMNLDVSPPLTESQKNAIRNAILGISEGETLADA